MVLHVWILTKTISEKKESSFVIPGEHNKVPGKWKIASFSLSTVPWEQRYKTLLFWTTHPVIPLLSQRKEQMFRLFRSLVQWWTHVAYGLPLPPDSYHGHPRCTVVGKLGDCFAVILVNCCSSLFLKTPFIFKDTFSHTPLNYFNILYTQNFTPQHSPNPSFT